MIHRTSRQLLLFRYRLALDGRFVSAKDARTWCIQQTPQSMQWRFVVGSANRLAFTDADVKVILRLRWKDKRRFRQNKILVLEGRQRLEIRRQWARLWGPA